MDIEILNIPEKEKVRLEKWAEITIEKWLFSIAQHKLIDTGTLFKSFAYSISSDANNNSALISFAFEYYLRMLEMGVGKGVKYNDRNAEGITERREFNKKRKAYQGIYSKTLYSEIMRLGELLTNQYAVAGATVIIDEFKHTTGEKTIYTKFSKLR